MATRITLEDIHRAWDARDPQLVDLVINLTDQPDEQPKTPIREGALTFRKFLSDIQSWQFRQKPEAEQMQIRVETMKALEAPDAEVPLPDRLRLWDIIMRLWQDNSPFARACLLQIIARVKITYGPWRAIKRIFKEAEAKGDTEVFGCIAARIDMMHARGGAQISRGTMSYMVRRAWRFYRRMGVHLPAEYPDACVEALVWYTQDANMNRTWVANHIRFHGTKRYGRTNFSYYQRPDSLTKYRAYEELWHRTPRPLFALLERARNDEVREFAAAALKTDFRGVLREVEPAWVARLVNVGSKAVDDFFVWILSNVPRFEQSAFRTLGLHEAVLRLFDSPSNDARTYAAEYARTHARDLPVEELVRLASNNHEPVRKLAFDLIKSRDPRKDIGLDAWGQLLESKYGNELAVATLKKSFGAKELTPDWFMDRLFSPNANASNFARQTLPVVHPKDKLGPAFFARVIDRIEENNYQIRPVAEFALTHLAGYDLNTLDQDFLKRLLVHPSTNTRAWQWIDEGRIKTSSLPLSFWKTLAFHPEWEADPWVAGLRASEKKWATSLAFNEALADKVLGWLKDVRRFQASDIGFEWLMQLVARNEPRYHDFAEDLMIKAFVPADFAPRAAPATTAAPAEVKVDFGGKTFVFTGKMATMKREDAEKKVEAANGVALDKVSAKLHYLVIGDEGSPLYGAGKKGSKQVKAEELNAGGANIQIISETAFYRLFTGQPATASGDATLAGCQRLWDMVLAPGTAAEPIAAFARKYIRRHHPDICLAETDRPVDPGAEIPPSFLTFDLVKPLFFESRKTLRDFALDLAKWEFARWSPPVSALLELCESPYGEVRDFVTTALLADEAPEHRRYRIDPSVLTPAAVYSFCESPDPSTRLLGMELIRRQSRLRLPEEMFRLTESPDRQVRGFIIRGLWSLYRDRGVTPDWKPHVPPQTTVTAAARKAAVKAEEGRGEGVPHRPEQPPADQDSLSEFLRRVLFEIPPGRLPPKPKEEGQREGIKVKLKPLPARKAKLSCVEVMRDLALEDVDFARGILPLLEEFMTSRGKSEQAACLVAVTRIRHKYPHSVGENGSRVALPEAKKARRGDEEE